MMGGQLPLPRLGGHDAALDLAVAAAQLLALLVAQLDRAGRGFGGGCGWRRRVGGARCGAAPGCTGLGRCRRRGARSRRALPGGRGSAAGGLAAGAGGGVAAPDSWAFFHW